MTTSTQTQLRRGTASQVAAMTPALGEAVVNTTAKTIHVGDGTTAGGNPLAPLASPAFTGTPSLPTGTTAVTQSPGDNDTSVATTAFVAAALAALPPASGLPAAVTGTLTTGSSAAFTVDFTTYSAYDLLIEGLTGSVVASSLVVGVSSNGGTSYAAETRANLQYGGGVSGNNSYDLPLTNGAVSALVGTLVQGATGGAAVLGYAGGYPTTVTQVGTTRYATAAAINRVRLSLPSGAFATGTVVLQPKALR